MHLDGDALCDYAEGALGASARAAAEAHLQACADCRRELQAIRAYFLEMAGLEPAKAPANFLANVRARLPRPSPWKAVLLVFMRPWRAIPMQIAVLTVLGITVITAYLYQRGGLEETRVTMLPAPTPSAPAEGLAKDPGPAVEAEENATRNAGAMEKKKRVSPRLRDGMDLDDSPRTRSGGRNGASGEAAGSLAAAPAQADEAEEMEPAGREDRAVMRSLAKSATAKARKAEASAPSGSPVAGNAVPKQASADVLPAIAVRMRAARDTSAILSGLKAMGAEIVSRRPGDGIRYLLQAPPSMVAEMPPYLERYGRIEKTGAPPSGDAAVPARLLLHLILP